MFERFPTALGRSLMLLPLLVCMACNVGGPAVTGATGDLVDDDEARELLCSDGADNDRDDLIDCDDPDCDIDPICDLIPSPSPTPTEEPTVPPQFGTFADNITGTATFTVFWDAAAQATYGVPAQSSDVLTLTGSNPGPEDCTPGCFNFWTATWQHTIQSGYLTFDGIMAMNGSAVALSPAGNLQTIYWDPLQRAWFYLVEEEFGTAQSWGGDGGLMPMNDPNLGYLGQQQVITSFRTF